MLNRHALAAAAFASVALGTTISMATPTAMLEAPEPAWRKVAVAINAQAPYPGHPSMPEDLSPTVGYGNAAYYHRYYVAAPERVAYAEVPNYAEGHPQPASETAAPQPLLDQAGTVQLAVAAITPADETPAEPDASAPVEPSARLTVLSAQGERPL